jgi:hypothetical protein
LKNSPKYVFVCRATGKVYHQGDFIANILVQMSSYQAAGTNVSNIIIVCENRAFINDTTCPRVLLNITSFEWEANGTLLYKGGSFGVKQVLQRSERGKHYIVM